MIRRLYCRVLGYDWTQVCADERRRAAMDVRALRRKEGEPMTAEDGAASRDELLARALLTLATVESAVAKIERYIESSGEQLPLQALVPMRAQTEAMRKALNAWKATR